MRHGVFFYEAMGLFRGDSDFCYGVFICEATRSLTGHFRTLEHDSRQIFCATAGVEELSASLITGVRKITNALRQADIEQEQTRKGQVPDVPPPQPVPVPVRSVGVKLEDIVRASGGKLANPGQAVPLVGQPWSPPPLRDPESEDARDAGSPFAIDVESKSEPGDQVPRATPEPAPERKLARPQAPIQHTPDSLTNAALDLFAQGRNRFEITQHFDATYSGHEIEGGGILQRVDTFSNDRILGRGPGVVAEIVVNLPLPVPTEDSDDAKTPPASSSHARPSSSVRVYVVLPLRENVTPGTQARELREALGKPVEVCGTLLRCDPFDARLHLIDSVLG